MSILKHSCVVLCACLVGSACAGVDAADDPSAVVDTPPPTEGASFEQYPVPTERGRTRVVTPTVSGDVEYAVIDGLAVTEGDILLGRADEIRAHDASHQHAYFKSGDTWPTHTIPFEFFIGVSDRQKQAVRDAAQHYKNNTNIRWKEFALFQGGSDVVRMLPWGNDYSQSNIGHQGGPQDMMLSPDVEVGMVIHEMGHALGLWHEQARGDRDKFITINWACIQFPFWYAYDSQPGWSTLSPYDYVSVMHYTAAAFRIFPGCPTIIRKDGGTKLGNSVLSANDKMALSIMYP